MTEDRSVLRNVAWAEVFPSVQLLSAWRIAISFRVLALSSLGLLVTWLGWRGIDRLFGVRATESLAGQWWRPGPDLRWNSLSDWWTDGPVARAWMDLSRPFVAAFALEVNAGQFAYLAMCGLWALAVWSFAGGGICRLAAVEFAREEKLNWRQLSSFVLSKWPSYFAAPLFPLSGVLLASIPLAILGLLIRTGGVGIVVVAILWPAALIAGAVMAILLVGLFFNWPLMWPTISTEGTDSFDALSRSYAYSFQRPLRYAGYVLMAAFVGLLAWLLVSLFGATVRGLTQWAISWGSGERIEKILFDRTSLTGASGVGADLIYFWNGAIELIVAAFAYGYFFVALTATYLLLRFHIDAMETDEVFLPDAEEAYGLPQLRTDSAGVPHVADVGRVEGSPEG